MQILMYGGGCLHSAGIDVSSYRKRRDDLCGISEYAHCVWNMTKSVLLHDAIYG